MWAQISGPSSVQSSSTLGLRKARQPICILRSKTIEQGQLLHPKICPPIFFKKLPRQVTKFPKGCAVQLSPIQSKLGFGFWARKWSFQRSNQVSYAYKDGQISSCQASRHSAQNCTVKTLIALQSTVGAKWSFDSQKFKFLVNISFWSHKHHLINAWSWFSKFGSEIIKDAKVALFGQLKKSTEIDQGITFTWIIRKIPSKAHF